MSRYRKIEVRTWADQGFRNLSPIPPSGQGLWFFLLTGPHTGPIPGLFRAGRASMAEELNWELEAFDKAFQEVFDNGMAIADFKAKLVWLPNALKHNKPESPNVVRSWRVELDLLPECSLKSEAIDNLRRMLELIGTPYVEAFDEVVGSGQRKAAPKAKIKPSRKASLKAKANQEQEQEQEQEQDQQQEQQQDQERSNPIVEQKPLDPVQTIFEYWQRIMKSPRSVLDDKRRRAITKALKGYSPADVCRAIRGCSKTPHNMGTNNSKTKHNGLGLILRDADHIDRFILNDAGNARPAAGTESIEETNARVMAELLDGQADPNVIDMVPA